MMDDLISKKSLLAAYDEKHKGPAGGARKLIEDAPLIPAVPLDKLCEWLEGFAAMECEGCRATIGSCEGDDGDESVCNSRERWKKMLTKWMEGLDGD